MQSEASGLFTVMKIFLIAFSKIFLIAFSAFLFLTSDSIFDFIVDTILFILLVYMLNRGINFELFWCKRVIKGASGENDIKLVDNSHLWL